MRKISLKQVTINGFKSFRDAPPVVLSGGSGLCFLGGDNQVDKRLGANGAGKSALWDAICWCFFGVSVRGKKTAALLNEQHGKKIEVEVELDIDGEGFSVLRQGPPDRIALDGEIVDEGKLVALLGLTRARFLQSVLFGQAVPLFYDLSIPERGELLDEVLDLGLWLQLADLAGARTRNVEQLRQEAQRTTANHVGRVTTLREQNDFEAQKAEWASAQERKIEECLDEVMEIEKEISECKAQRRDAKKRLAAFKDSVDGKRLHDLKKAKARLDVESGELLQSIRADYEQLTFFQKHLTCPTCKQRINSVLKERKMQLLTERVEQLNAESQQNAHKSIQLLKEVNQLENDVTKHQRKCQHYEQIVEQATTDIRRHMRRFDALEDTLNALSKEVNPYARQQQRVEKALHEAEQELEKAQEQEAQLTARQAVLEYWKQGFKRVRLFLVKRILLQLEIETANAANMLGLVGWKISYVTEVANKSGTMKPGVQILVTAPDTAQAREWSPGELQRVRIASAIGLASMIQRMAGVIYNFEVWDEPSNWLSTEGIEDLLECLRTRASAMQRRIWVVDHRAPIFTGFSEYWRATKTKHGTTISRIGT